MSKEVKATRLDAGIKRGEQIEFYFDGQPIKAFKGETIAAALMASGHMVARTIDNQPLGVLLQYRSLPQLPYDGQRRQ